MWLLAAAMFAGLKILTLSDSAAIGSASTRRIAGYLLAWPGLDAERFLSGARATGPSRVEWLSAATKTLAGAVLLMTATTLIDRAPPLVWGWVGMIGIVMGAHFGVFHLLSAAWRQCGVDAPPIMDRPALAASAGQLWGRRWNRAFRDLASRYLFRPIVPAVGTATATMAVFAFSGMLHDLVISVPAQQGFGLPTSYFLIQGLAELFEHCRLGKRLGLGRGVIGRIFCLSVALAPLPLLFHGAFVKNVAVPMLRSLGGMGWEI
jgi:hypothetical protein